MDTGIKTRIYKAATIYDYNLGVREKMDYREAMFHDSLFRRFLLDNKMKVKNGATRDIVCLEFDFKSRSYEEDKKRLIQLRNNTDDEERIKRLDYLIAKADKNKDKYVPLSKDEIRKEFYENGVDIEYKKYIKKEKKWVHDETIHYVMLYRNASKAKVGQVIFINKKLYMKARKWLTMQIYLPRTKAKIVELSAYAPLTTSSIVDTLHIPVDDVLILEDKDSVFHTIADIVKAKDYIEPYKELDVEKTEKAKRKAIEEGHRHKNGHPIYEKQYITKYKKKRKCIVSREETDVKNTLWDGQALIESSICPDWINGMALLRNHFFKACAFKTNIQLFFKDYALENNIDYDTWQIKDMFGEYHYAKDIKLITTDNAIKWKKFSSLMGDNPYEYWKNKIKNDGCIWGVVKTDHPSKLGDVQQMSYQMVNTLPCTKEDMLNIAKTSIDYVNNLKTNPDEFEKFLRKNATAVNHFNMLADLYKHNPEFARCKWFGVEKRQIINAYVDRLKSGKITVYGDNLTLCGNPYALLKYAACGDWSDDTFKQEKGVIQCYTTRFNDGEYLCGFRNPHNSPNNVCYFHNVYSDIFEKYFCFTGNIMAVNCIGTDIQDRANGCDFDSDFMFVTNHPTIVKCAKICYEKYPTVVNALKESGVTYRNEKSEYARMDSKFARSQRGIGESSNLAQLAMSYYWTDIANGRNDEHTKELYDNTVILAVLAQVVIDGCKREYEIDATEEIARIKSMDCMTITKTKIINGKPRQVKHDFPYFMKYTRKISLTKNGAELPYENITAMRSKLKDRINTDIICPMNWLMESLNTIKRLPNNISIIPTEDFFVRMDKSLESKYKIMNRIKKMIIHYDNIEKALMSEASEDSYDDIIKEFNILISMIRNIKALDQKTINRLVEISLGIANNKRIEKWKPYKKYSRKIMNALYNARKTGFLNCFVSGN